MKQTKLAGVQMGYRPESRTRIIVGNLSYTATEAQLQQELEKYADVVHVEIPRRPDDRSKGLAVVLLKTAEDVQAIIEKFHKQVLFGRIVFISSADDRDARDRGHRDRYERRRYDYSDADDSPPRYRTRDHGRSRRRDVPSPPPRRRDSPPRRRSIDSPPRRRSIDSPPRRRNSPARRPVARNSSGDSS
jgi:RNA recognition motif-containing protein